MISILSPAKTLDFDSPLLTKRESLIRFSDETLELLKVLKNYSIQDIQSLMSVSEKIAELNYKRYQNFDIDFSSSKTRQALLAFKGDVYRPFQLESYTDEDFLFAQKHLRILSGFYGLLRPLDSIQPYRLEMKTKLKNPKGKDLYQFWGSKLTQILNQDLKDQGDDLVINLASKEYWKSIQPKELQATVINVHFLAKKKNQEPKIIAILAKKARGVMADFLIKNQINSVNEIKSFNKEGYLFSKSLSDDQNLYFIKPYSN